MIFYNPTARDRAQEFIEKKFFSFSPQQFSNYAKHYRDLYGGSSYQYLLKTYSDWKHGWKGMSGQTRWRILNCVPKFLSRSEQIYILRFYLPHPSLSRARISDTSTSRGLHVEDLTELFTAEFKRISGEKLHLDWFVSAVFEAQEIAQFTEAYRFLLLKRLSFTFEAAVRDLRRLRDLIERAPCFTEVTYRIDYFNKALSSSAVLVLPIPESNWNYETPEILRSNDPEVTEMLSEQFLTLRHEQEEAQIMALMSAHDVETALALVSPSDTQEVDTTLKARGEGGVVTIRFIKKDVKRLDWEKRKHQWTLVGFCSLTLGVYAHAYRHGYIKYLIFPAQRELAGSRQQGNSRQG